MANEKEAVLAPYLAFKTFRSAIQDLRIHGLPQTLDRTAWDSKSGTDQSQIMNSLKFFGLTDEKGITLSSLKELVGLAEDAPEERAYVGALLRNSYAEVFKLDLKSATPKQLEDAIGMYGVTGILKDRAVRFFLKAASHAAVPLSTRLTKNLRDRSIDDAQPQNGDSAETTTSDKPNGGGKTKKRRRTPTPTLPAPQVQPPTGGANAMKTIQLPSVGGSLTISGTFNPFMMVGPERDLVFKIIDLMTAYEKGEAPKVNEGETKA